MSGNQTYTSNAYHNSYVRVGYYDLTFEMTNHEWKSGPDHDNYKFYEWVTAGGVSQESDQGWESTDLKTNGELTDTSHGATFNKVVRFCYYKAPADANSALNALKDVCGNGNINLDVGSGSNGEIVHDYQNEGARTEVSDPTNSKEPTTASNRDHTVTSTQNIYLEKYVGIASTCASQYQDTSGTAIDGLSHGNEDIFAWGKIYAQDQFTLSITEVRAETHVDSHTADGISISANIQTSPGTVSDFLFVSGEHAPAATSLGDAFPSKQASSFDITYSTSWSGALSASTSTTCSSELTASAQSGNAHCYSEVDTNPQGVNYSPTATNSGCTAKLVSSCTIEAPTLSDSIKYQSDNGHSMPEVGGDYAYTLGASTTVDHNSAIVVAVRQYATRQYPLGFTPGTNNGLSEGETEGDAAAAQLIARYENDMSAKTLGDKLGLVATTNKEMLANVFSCTQDIMSGDCTDDPMYILGAVVDQSLAVACSFNQAGYWDETTPNGADDGAPDANNVCTIEQPHDIPSANSIPTTAATSLHIQLPPANTPQFYVYGIATYQRAYDAGSISGGMTGQSDVNDQGSDSVRRLRATKQVRKAFDQVTTSLDNAPITQVIDQIHYAVQM